jgi:hypothetical protein
MYLHESYNANTYFCFYQHIIFMTTSKLLSTSIIEAVMAGIKSKPLLRALNMLNSKLWNPVYSAHHPSLIEVNNRCLINLHPLPTVHSSSIPPHIHGQIWLVLLSHVNHLQWLVIMQWTERQNPIYDAIPCLHTNIMTIKCLRNLSIRIIL